MNKQLSKSSEEIQLSDRYDLTKKRVLLSGTQALIRMLFAQKARDKKLKLNTAGFVSGYRGSPIGGLDLQLWQNETLLKEHDVVFEPGINEDIAATSIWGAQQAEMRGEGKYDGVFGLWYGKGPGVDRSGDAFRHANLAGTSKHGGVLAIMGDDHVCESSTTAHQSEFHFLDVMMPVLHPAGVQEILDYGHLGYALSRFAGVWVGLKCVKDNIESTAIVDGRIDRVEVVKPTNYKMPKGGLNIRPQDHPVTQEARLHDEKRAAVVAFVEANKINKMMLRGGKTPKLGIITTGKSYLDVRQALDDLGIDKTKANQLGIRLFKIGCVWPIPPKEIVQFAKGLDRILVVEEKRSLIEVQVKEALYGTKNQPLCEGKHDEKGKWLFPVKGALDVNQIAIAIGERVSKYKKDQGVAAKLRSVKRAQSYLLSAKQVAERVPYFCAGCPHSTSTKIPDGSRAYAGIGCHYMVQWMDRGTEGFTQMGGEGVNWIGEHQFSKRDHVFQNLGDGTYNHSGYMALRAAGASGANITYKILYNDAVAMTGGQPNEGGLQVDEIARQVAAIGVERLVLVSDEPDKYPANIQWPSFMTFHHRSELMVIQKELAETKGLTVMIYDQTCATEKRRRRKRGTYPDPAKDVVINEQVCEGCGDCGVQSNCVAIDAVETEFGRKRQIDASSCNKDFSCVEGFCPSFVTVHGGVRKSTAGIGGANLPQIKSPKVPKLEGLFGIVVTGIGGTGVVTLSNIIAMAAHIEGKGCGTIDMAGLAQKGGSVTSHLRLAPQQEDIAAIRISAGNADLILGCDLVTAASVPVLATMKKGKTKAIFNGHETLSGDFTKDVDFSFPVSRLIKEITQKVGDKGAHHMDATKIAKRLLGNTIAGNMFLLGVTWQIKGLPLTREAILQAIELNGTAVEMNKAAFEWGRVWAEKPEALSNLLKSPTDTLPHRKLSKNLNEIITRRYEALVAYQDQSYADDYLHWVKLLQAKVQGLGLKTRGNRLVRSVSENLYKLMAIKDEYEVGRLYSDGTFERQLRQQFQSWDKLEFHLAPPLWVKLDANGEIVKKSYGSFMQGMFARLYRWRRVRGKWYDPFSYLQERKLERQVLHDYLARLEAIIKNLDDKNLNAAVALAAYPEKIKGYGHIRKKSIEAADRQARMHHAAFMNVGAKIPSIKDA